MFLQKNHNPSRNQILGTEHGLQDKFIIVICIVTLYVIILKLRPSSLRHVYPYSNLTILL
jgi:hypothetical protein